MPDTWEDFLSVKKRLMLFSALVVTGTSFVAMFSKFMIWNEKRAGTVFDDPILQWMDPVNLSRITMPLTLIPIFAGLVFIFSKPKTTVYFFFAAVFICTLRALTMLLVPLENLFYGGQVLQKDLFFSGHTANIVLIGLLTDDLRMRKLLFSIACIVGFLLMWQRVHYSFDVFAAPFFAYILQYNWCKCLSVLFLSVAMS